MKFLKVEVLSDVKAQRKAHADEIANVDKANKEALADLIGKSAEAITNGSDTGLPTVQVRAVTNRLAAYDDFARIVGLMSPDDTGGISLEKSEVDNFTKPGGFVKSKRNVTVRFTS